MTQTDPPSSARRSRILSLLAEPVFEAMPAWGHSWPANPIRLVVPFPPGGATDVVACALGEPLRARVGQVVVIDNKPGASTLIGADAVVKAPPDGHTRKSR